MLSMTRSVVILSSFSAAAWAAEQRLRGSNATQPLTSSGPCCSFDGCKTCADWCTQQGRDVCLAPQGAPGGGCDNSHSDPSAHPPQWCGAGELSANDAQLRASSVTCSSQAVKACADSNLFCIYDKAGCQAGGAQCGIRGESKGDDQYNCRYCDQPKPTGGSITDGAHCQLPLAVLAEPVSGSNGTQPLTSSGPCCSFDGCKTCADWCTQQGKEVCLAPAKPGPGCDSSGDDSHAAPPQWCEAGAGELSANDAPVSDDVELASGDSCSQFCCWSGSDCGSCGDDWNNRMYEAGCQVPCTGANCGPGQAHQYFNTQPGALGNCNSPGIKCY